MLGRFQENNQPNDFDIFIGFVQIYSLLLNLNQTSNDTILKELQKQNKEYLERIMEQNNQIIKLLEDKNKNNKV